LTGGTSGLTDAGGTARLTAGARIGAEPSSSFRSTWHREMLETLTELVNKKRFNVNKKTNEKHA